VELIGDSEDRIKARDIYDGILARSTPEVHELSEEMYTPQFEDLGMQ
jgi:hypothetical protein